MSLGAFDSYSTINQRQFDGFSTANKQRLYAMLLMTFNFLGLE